MMVDISDEEAVELLSQYGTLIKRIADSAYKSSPVLDVHDLYQIGQIAVLRAIREYDPTNGMSMKSFVTRLVRQDIYNEAARFLGIFTVDHRTTRMASKITKLFERGLEDKAIAEQVGVSEQHVRDLRFVYSRRHYLQSEDDSCSYVQSTDEYDLEELFHSIVENDTEQEVLNNRILSTTPVKELAASLNISQLYVSQIEERLRSRIQRAIREII